MASVQISDSGELTEKEAEALRLVYARYTSKQIAREFGISASSVDKRLDSARRKLGAATRADAARLWAEEHYGERLTGHPLPVPEPDHLTDPRAVEPPNVHQRWFDARLDPRGFGPLGRTAIIVAGAVIMLVMVLMVLGIAEGLNALLEYLLGPSNGPSS